jgi:uncharacterized protein (TIGR00255 family)
MTAFASANKQTELGTYSWEIRSVNSRYLELHFRLPDALRSIEGPLREQLRNSLTRGKVECTLKFSPNQSQQTLSINDDLVAQINQAADQVHGIIGPGNALSALEILKWPGVIIQGDLNREATNQESLNAFNGALSQLIEMREREGQALNAFIHQRLDNIGEQVKKVSDILPQILETQRQALKAKLDQLVDKVDPDRIEQEMVILLQKADVNEELDRLKAHLEEVARILKQKGAIGRRLDFMMQELNREANTLSSKSISHLTTQTSVELKVLIEQMREQIQNIE